MSHLSLIHLQEEYGAGGGGGRVVAVVGGGVVSALAFHL